MSGHTYPPALASLTAKYLTSRAADPGDLSDSPTAVEPHEAPSGFRTDSRTTWTESVLAARLTGAANGPVVVPAGWASLTRETAPRVAVPLCVGNYPQLFGDLSKLGGPLDPAPTHGHTPSGSLAADKKTSPELAVLVAAAGRRLSGDAAGALETLARNEDRCSVIRVAWENEQAAALWEAGRRNEAITVWQALPAGPVKSFNLGMAYLFTGRPADSKATLEAASAALPESSGWVHLARLYMALAEAR